MARLLVLTDRPPNDADWKGALTWRIILALAESHHEVLVLTPVPLAEIPTTHPRLTVVNPVGSWRVDQFPKMARVFLSYQPQVVHSFAFRPSRLWSTLSVWPMLHALSVMLPGAARFSTFFDPSDCSKADEIWHRGSARITVFSEEHRAPVAALLGRPVDVVPLDLEQLGDMGAQAAGSGRVLVPAAVSDWENPSSGLDHLAAFLRRHPENSVHVIGGWGKWP
jgi:hypothetical protein